MGGGRAGWREISEDDENPILVQSDCECDRENEGKEKRQNEAHREI